MLLASMSRIWPIQLLEGLAKPCPQGDPCFYYWAAVRKYTNQSSVQLCGVYKFIIPLCGQTFGKAPQIGPLFSSMAWKCKRQKKELFHLFLFFFFKIAAYLKGSFNSLIRGEDSIKSDSLGCLFTILLNCPYINWCIKMTVMLCHFESLWHIDYPPPRSSVTNCRQCSFCKLAGPVLRSCPSTL